MARVIRRGLTVVAVALVAAACSSTPTSSAPASGSGTATPTDGPNGTPSVAIADLRFTCGTFPFGADVVTAPPRQDQDALTPEAAALRTELANSPPENGLPARGWRLIGSAGGKAEFIAVGADGNLVVVGLVSANGAWTLDQLGSCQANVVVAAGVGPASWAWGSPGAPDAATRTFDALVTEQACASGRKADGRVIGPIVVPTADMVLVFFGVHPLPGAQDCPSNPSTRVPVDLGEPLGTRKLLDGGHLPFADPAKPAT